MPRTRLSQKFIDKLKAPTSTGKPQIFWDLAEPGFGLLVSGKTNQMAFVAQRDLPNGKTRRVTLAKVTELTLDQARQEARDQLYQMRKGVDPKATRRGAFTLRETLALYLDGNPKLGERSRKEYPQNVQAYLKGWLDLPMGEITGDMVEDVHQALGKQKGQATANLTMRIFRALFNYASERTPLPQNPTKRLRRQWFPQPRREDLVKADALPGFYQAVRDLENPIVRDYLLLLLFTGLRRREAAALSWTDVDFKSRLIRLPASRTKAKRKLDLPMSDFVHKLLQARRKLGDTRWCFPANSKSGHVSEPKQFLDRVGKQAGIKVTVHGLRRTFITAAESAEISPMSLKALVNHSLGNDVTSGYVVMSVDRLREPAQRVADLIKSWCGL